MSVIVSIPPALTVRHNTAVSDTVVVVVGVPPGIVAVDVFIVPATDVAVEDVLLPLSDAGYVLLILTVAASQTTLFVRYVPAQVSISTSESFSLVIPICPRYALH